MSTAMIAEGKIRALMYHGKPVPEGFIQDAAGNPANSVTYYTSGRWAGRRALTDPCCTSAGAVSQFRFCHSPVSVV